MLFKSDHLAAPSAASKTWKSSKRFKFESDYTLSCFQPTQTRLAITLYGPGDWKGRQNTYDAMYAWIPRYHILWKIDFVRWVYRMSHMMTSSNGNIFRIAGPLWGESTGDWWILLTKANDEKLWCFLWSAPEQTVGQTIETPMIWGAIAFIVTSL